MRRSQDGDRTFDNIAWRDEFHDSTSERGVLIHHDRQPDDAVAGMYREGLRHRRPRLDGLAHAASAAYAGGDRTADEVMTRRSQLMLIAIGALAGCGPEGDMSSGTTETGGVELRDIGPLSARNVRIRWSATGSGLVRIERASDLTPFETVSTKPARHGRFLDLALTPQTTYRYRLTYCVNPTTCGPALDLPPVTTPKSQLLPFEVDIPAQATEDNLVVFGVATLEPDLLDVARMAAVDRDGNVVWEYVREAPMLAPVTEVQLLDDGTLATGHNATFIRMDLDGTELYRYEGNTAHHDIDPTRDGGFVLLTFDVFANGPGDPILGDGIEVVRAGEQFPAWSWLARDHIPISDRDPVDWENVLFGIGRDWTHANAVTFDEDGGKVYVNVRNLDRLYCIGYPSGEVLWVMGEGGDFGEGIWSHSHDPTFTAPNRFLMFDNGALRAGTSFEYSRVIEVEFDADARRAEVVWEYRETPDFYAFAQGAVSIEPNGNVFVTDGINARIFEVTRDKQVVWRMRMLGGAWTYKSITVPRQVFEDW